MSRNNIQQEQEQTSSDKQESSPKKYFSALTYASIIGAFIASAILTIYVDQNPEPSDENNDATPVVEAPVPEEEPKKDSIVVKTVMEEDPYVELESLIGLKEVKAEVTSLANFVKVQQQRKEQGLKVPSISYHCVFTGNPGTGKTTIARILARIFRDLGVLKKGHLVETDRSGLVAEYVGQTAVKTNAIIDSALNGVLFIDEAYALTNETKGGYGAEAIATLVKRMEDDRDSLVVIVAGYKNEMDQFVKSNPGLMSRFTRFIEFPDYTSTELVDIFYMRAKKYCYVLDEKADAYLRERMNYAVAHKTRSFGNGRYARNVFEKAITIQANRLSKMVNPTREDLESLTAEDLKEAFRTVKK